jgi:hypothetical protein
LEGFFGKAAASISSDQHTPQNSVPDRKPRKGIFRAAHCTALAIHVDQRGAEHRVALPPKPSLLHRHGYAPTEI